MRPVLKPALRRLWRDPATLQLGIDPHHAVVLSGIELNDASLLDLLDGSRTVEELTTEALRLGHDGRRVGALLQALGDAEALDDAPHEQGPVDARRQPDLLSLSLLHPSPGTAAAVMAARHAATVEILGAGRVGATVASLLSAAGVGLLEITDSGPIRSADFAPGGIRSAGSRHGTRADAARLVVGPKSADRQADPGATVVLAPPGSVVPPEWLGQVRHRPHLPVVIRETTAVIGPFVLPGRTPCLRCVELTRGDRDPAWPALAAQLIGQSHRVEPCDIALASAAAGIVGLHVLAWLDRGDSGPGAAGPVAAGPHDDRLPPSIGGVIELSLTDLRLRRRTVVAHPGCGCGAADH